MLYLKNKYLIFCRGTQNLLEFVGGLLEHRSLNPDIRVKLVR